MNKVHILDCTLRDGGYCNEWRFGFDNIRKITSGLVEANAIYDAMNLGMSKVLKEYAEIISLKFITEPKFVRLD